MFTTIKDYKILIIFFTLILISFIFGFYLNEDSAGGGEADYIDHEWGTIKLFANNTINIALQSALYESSRTPLFYILNKFNPFNDDLENLRRFWFIFSFAIPLLLYKSLKLTKINHLDETCVYVFSFTILLSPYFRTNSFWPSSENLVIFFVLSSIYFYIYLKNKDFLKKTDLYLFSILCTFFAYCAFYTDQKAFFLAAILYFELIRKNNFSYFFFISSINLIFFLPAIYLYFTWGGLVPIESQFRVSKYFYGTNIFISSIGIYFIIVFFTNFKNIDILKSIKNKWIEIIFVLFFLLYLIFTLPNEPITFGSGIISKLFGIITSKLNLNWQLVKYVYFLINVIFVLVIYLILKKTIKNFIIILSFLIVYNLTSITYQSYVDPVFFVIILTLFDFNKNIVIFNKKTSYLFLSFYFIMLVSSIIFRSYII